MELAISKLTARRVIYYFEGYVKGEGRRLQNQDLF